MLYFFCIPPNLHLPRFPRNCFCLLEPPVIPTSKQNNNYKKLDFSTGRMLKLDKPRYTELLIPIKYILKSNKKLQLSSVQMNLCHRDCFARYKYDCRLRQEFKSLKIFCTSDKEIITIERSFTTEQRVFELSCSNSKKML